MKRILFLLVAYTLITNVNAQQFYNPLAADSYIQLHEPLKINKKTHSTVELQSSQRNVIWSENFSNGIPNTWSYNGYYTNSNGVVVSFPDLTQNPPLYGWEYRGVFTSPDLSQGSVGLYSGINNNPPTNSPLSSTTPNDGFIIFDSDFLDNANTAMGAGPAPTPHVGCLITDIIDCSNYADIQLKMSTYHRSFYGQTFVAFSIDGGQSWPDTLEIHLLEVNESTETDNVELLNVSNYIGGESSVQMQFIFEGATEGNANGTGYYFWQMDDIELSVLPSNDLVLNDIALNMSSSVQGIANSWRDFYGHVPTNQVTDAEFGFAVYNFGSGDQTNVTTTVSAGAWTDSENYGILERDSSFVVYHVNQYMPTTVGQYNFNFSVSSDSTDASQINNVDSVTVTVTDTIFNAFGTGDDFGFMGTGFFDNGGDDGFKMANMYELEVADELTSVTLGLRTNGATMPGALVQVSVFDTTGFFSASIESPFIYSNFYTITESDTTTGFATIPIPTNYNGNVQDRNIAPGAYYISIECYNSAGTNDIVIYDDQTFPRGPWSSMIYITGDRWYTNGDAFWISANFGSWDYNYVNETNSLSSFNVFPNPSSGLLQISYTLNENTNTSVRIKDLNGKIVFENQYGNQNPGIYSEKIDLSDLSNGVYLYEISAENHLSQGKIVLTK
jgi:hypothetical protein